MESPYDIDGRFKIVDGTIRTLHDISFVWCPDSGTSNETIEMVCDAMNSAFEVGFQSGRHDAQKAMRMAIGIK